MLFDTITTIHDFHGETIPVQLLSSSKDPGCPECSNSHKLLSLDATARSPGIAVYLCTWETPFAWWWCHQFSTQFASLEVTCLNQAFYRGCSTVQKYLYTTKSSSPHGFNLGVVTPRYPRHWFISVTLYSGVLIEPT